MFFSGCGKPVSQASKPSNTNAEPVATLDTNPTANLAEPVPGKDGKVCFACQGTGVVKCTAPGCVDGKVDCPGPCLKLSHGTWVHLNVAGHSPTDLWQKFYLPNGSYDAYSQAHVGHVIVMQNGHAVDTGPCKICGGTGKVDCSVCKGTGEVACPICDGKKYVPVSWTPTDNPWLNAQSDLIRLASGQVLFGKAIYTNGNGTDITIKTRDGRFMHVPASDLGLKGTNISKPL
ncbi:MAG TPA: hypothetical protein VGO57_09025 [Verrucomicrobiae bacterium]